MRRVLKCKKLLVVIVVFLSVVATAAAPSTIKATISPDITIMFNDEKQVMKDVNGETVYPIIYNGTTYLPIRALCEMIDIPVNWVRETRTVELGEGEKEAVSLFDAIERQETHTYGSAASGWLKTTDKNLLYQPSDGSNNKTGDSYTYGINVGKVKYVATWDEEPKYQNISATTYHLNTQCNELSGTWYVFPSEKRAVIGVRIIDAERETVLYDGELPNGNFTPLTINAMGTRTLRFEARIINSSAPSPLENIVCFMNPTVK